MLQLARQPRTWLAALLVGLAIAATARAADTAADDTAAVAAARSISHAFTAVARKATPAVVSIRVEERADETAMQEGGFPPGFPHFRMPEQGRRVGQGSGFLVSADGLILTNNHVIAGAERLDVRLADGRELKGKVVGADQETDLAVVRVDAKDLPFLRLADSDRLEVGEWVVAVGSPFGLRETVTAGIVSAKGRSRVGIAAQEDFIQTDAAINPGNSGGPLLNLDGEVVGINSAILSRTGANNGVGFAIPSNLARMIRDQLVATGHIVRGYLGVVVQDLTPDLAASFGVKEQHGALVSEVAADSGAAKAGVREGDVIVAVDDRPVADTGELRNRVAMLAPGTKVDLTLVRDSAEQHVPATLGEQPGEAGAPASSPEKTAAFGLAVAPLTEDLASRLGYADTKGVLVREVAPGGAAERAGIAAGNLIESVDRKPVTSVAEFDAALAKAGDGRVLLRVRDGDHARYVVLSAE
ncbi:MAG TPA: DegQ family serine endoprotease [Planctomycetota bacterium]|nr:DegQ family serine endoprotease [Planctomycetota bacterium]